MACPPSPFNRDNYELCPCGRYMCGAHARFIVEVWDDHIHAPCWVGEQWLCAYHYDMWMNPALRNRHEQDIYFYHHHD